MDGPPFFHFNAVEWKIDHAKISIDVFSWVFFFRDFALFPGFLDFSGMKIPVYK